MAASFSPSRFLDEIRQTSSALGAPYSEEVTRKVLETFPDSFNRGAVLWRATDKKGGSLDYRFYERRAIDTVAIAFNAGLLTSDNADMARLITTWSSLYGGTPEQSCDFDAELGLVKTWVFLKGLRPLDDILDASGVPDTLRIHQSTFHTLGLDTVRHVAVEYAKSTVNLYFRARGPLSRTQAAKFNELAGARPPTESEFLEMLHHLNPLGFTFSVTLKATTGAIERVAYYALKLPVGIFPEVSDGLKDFFAVAPSYDPEEMNAIAWSFGPGSQKYVKAERSYCGGLVSLMRDWNSTFSDSGPERISAQL
ncbi:Aromatic prenyltransferase protein [Rutstroemia sp. NJR-2017a BVV2]|nr:Aromatic prenyltransferase protein [Rutstroemia sp. NJR-2017a BVV2]